MENMFLRTLKEKDAPLMLEWMHDKDVIENLKENFLKKTLSDAETFIVKAKNNENSIHFAICSDEDEYMGTVSLKNIDTYNHSAEFAIIVRKSAMGRGYSWYGMEEILQKAFVEYGLECVYWCVSRSNHRAIRFYEKHNFHEMLDIPSFLLERYDKLKKY